MRLASERSLEVRRETCEERGLELSAGSVRSVALGKEPAVVQRVATIPVEHRLIAGLTRLGDDLVLGGYEGLVIVRASGAIEALQAPGDQSTLALQRSDVDGDGDLDVVSQVEHNVVANGYATSAQRRVVWLADAGTLRRAHAFDPDGRASPEAPLVGDLDGDKRPEALQVTELGVPLNAAHELSELLDFDGDGALDVVFASRSRDGTEQSQVGVLRSVGKLPRGKPVVSAVAEAARAIQGFGDVSGDGIADLAFSAIQREPFKYQVHVAYGRRDGTFARGKLVFAGFDADPLIRYADVDGDAQADLVAVQGAHVVAWKLKGEAPELLLDREIDGLGNITSVHVDPAAGAAPAVMYVVASGCDGHRMM